MSGHCTKCVPPSEGCKCACHDRAIIADLERQLAEARAETRELAEKGYEASVWGWSKERARLADQLAEAQGKLEAVRELWACGFTHERLEDFHNPMSAREMQSWWQGQLGRILDLSTGGKGD
ncbi:MAG: hypothetical protein V3U27_21470 [Candidatus Tectomicrobia bacterium]